MAVDPTIAALETQARAYCAAVNMDPDMMIGAGDNQRPMWQNAAVPLRTLKAQLIALGVTVPQ